MAGTNKSSLLSVKGYTVPVSIDKVKPYKNPNITKSYGTSLRNINAEMDRMIFGESFLVLLRKGISEVEYQIPVRWDSSTIISYHVLVNGVVSPEDKRNDSKVFHHAKNDEIRILIERNTWSDEHIQSLPPAANIIGGRFANFLKNT